MPIEIAGLEEKLRHLFAELDVEDVLSLRQENKRDRSFSKRRFSMNYKKRLYRDIKSFANDTARILMRLFVPAQLLKIYPMPALQSGRKRI